MKSETVYRCIRIQIAKTLIGLIFMASEVGLILLTLSGIRCCLPCKGTRAYTCTLYIGYIPKIMCEIVHAIADAM